MTCQVPSMELNKNLVESEVKHQKIFIPLRVKPSSRFTFGPPLIRHICWSTPGLLENVAGVTGGLLSPPASQNRRGKSFAGGRMEKKNLLQIPSTASLTQIPGALQRSPLLA